MLGLWEMQFRSSVTKHERLGSDTFGLFVQLDVWPIPVMQSTDLHSWSTKYGENQPLFAAHHDRPDHFGTFSEHTESFETVSAESLDMHRNAPTGADLINESDPNGFEEMKSTLLERWCPAGGFWSAVVGLLTTAVTPAVLSLPLAVSMAGLLFAAVMMSVCVVMTLLSVRYIAMAAVCSKEADYSFVVAYFLGTRARSFVLNVLVFSNFGSGVVNLRFILENFHSMLTHFSVKEAWPLSFIGLCGICVCLLPLMFRSRISSLKTAGFVSDFAVLCIAGVVIYEYFLSRVVQFDTGHAQAEFAEDDSPQKSTVHSSHFVTLLFVAPIYIFSYEVQSNVLSVIEDLDHPTQGKIALIVTAAMMIATTLYMLIGAFGAMTFPPGAPVGGNVLKSYPVQDVPLLFSQVLCLFASSVAFLFTMFPCRYAIHSALWSRGRIPAARRAQISLFLCVAGCLTALLVPDVAVAVSWIGALCSSTLSMTIPALLAFKMRASSGVCQGWYEPILASALLIGGLGMAILGTTRLLWAPEM